MADFSITGEVRLNSDQAEKSTSKWTVAAGQMIADFANQASSKLAEVVKSGVDYNATMESYLTNFKVMLGSEEAAATKLSEIRKMAASTPFSLDDLTSGTQTLLQFGIAADDTTGVLQRLGDISLGNAEKLQTLTRAYGKMSSAQKVTLENVNMMIDAGFNPLNQICDATGESMSDLYKRISDGKVSFSELEAAVEAATSQGGQFYNGMLEASQTFSGRMSTLKDNVSALTGELTSGLFAALGDLVVKLNEAAVSFLDNDEKMAQLKETIGIATAAVVAVTAAVLSYKATVAATTAITALCTAATTAKAAADKAAEAGAKGLAVAQAALNAVMKANTVGIVVSAVAALAAGLVTAYQTSETFRNFVGGAFQFVADIAKSTIGAAIGWLDKLSYKLNRFLGKAATADFDTYEEYSDEKQKQSNKDRLRQNALNGVGISNKSWTERQNEAKAAAEAAAAASTSAASTITSNANKTAKAATKAVTASVVKSISDTTTTVKDGITRTVETVNETLSNGKPQQKQTITETSRQMVDGVLKDVKTITEVAADGTKTVKQTMETVRETAKTVTSTFETLADGVKTTTQTITETLTDGTETQKQVITETYDDVVDGALVTIERVKTIAADGTVQVAETTKKSAADTFDGLWKELQDSANTGVLGTFDDLYTAVKNQDWLSVGKWVASTIYSGLTADQKQQVQSFALGIVDKLNKALGGARDQLVQGAIDLGGQIVNGLTGGFSEVWQQAQGLGSTLLNIFNGLKDPLQAAALAISQGLSGGFLSCMPEILAGAGSVIVAIGSAFTGMLEAIGAVLTGFGIPTGPAMIIAGVALVAAIAGIVAALGVSFSKKGSSGRGGSSGGSSGSGSMGSVDITTGTGSLEDAINANTKVLTKTNSALADMIRQAGALVLSDNMRLGSTVAASGTAQVVSAARSYHREGDTTINQYIQSKAQTAADLARETRWEADRARRQRR